MNYGVIDLGSNSVRLVIYKKSQDRLKIVYNKRESVGLIAYIDKNQNLNEAGILRLKEILYKLIKESNAFNCNSLSILGTEVFRVSKNKEEVIDYIQKEFNMKIEVLSRNEESLYGAYSMMEAFHFENGYVVDIGGGSTKVAQIHHKEYAYLFGVGIGSFNMYLQFIKHIIPKQQELLMLRKHIQMNLGFIKKQEIDITTLYGIGGTFKALKKLINAYFDESIDTFKVSDVKTLIERISSDYESYYLELMRLIPDRAHTILPGLIIIDEIANFLKVDLISVGNQGLREGYILNKLRKELK